MRKILLALAVTLAASTASRALPGVGYSEFGAAGSVVQHRQNLPGGFAGSGQGNLPEGKVILAKGDKTGTGPGAGGHKGQKKGAQHGKQHDNKGKGKGKS
jgi:hypothetical protein